MFFVVQESVLDGSCNIDKISSPSIPYVTMSAFQVPKGICDAMDGMVRRFWWKPRSESSKYFVPAAWSSLCKPLVEGGLGFRCFYNLNQALLSKLAWWVLSD